MSFVRKWPIARAELTTEEGVSFIAEARAGTGVWVVRDGFGNDDDGSARLRGLMTDFPDEEGSAMLVLTAAQRAELEMDDRTYLELNVRLSRDFEDLRRRRRRDELP